MKHRTNSWNLGLLAASLAAGLIVWLALAPATGVSPEPNTGVGQVVTCSVDTNSGCTLQHGLGAKPVVTVTAGGKGQLVSVPANLITATSYRVNFNWHNGATFPIGTRFTFQVHFDLPAASPTSPPTTPTPPPSSTPPTTVSPTPTPTDPGPSPVKACTDPSFTTTAGPANYNGAARDWDDRDFPGRTYITHNDMWNNDNGTYTMNACSYDNWYELATQPDTTDGSVKVYPKSSRNYCAGWELSYCGDYSPNTTDRQMPLDRVESVRFAHNTTKVPGMVWNVAFDIWINNGLENELMIWTENHGQRPAGNRLADTTIGGRQYQVWKAGSGAGGIFTYVEVNQRTFGTMPLSLFFDDLKQRGWLRPKSGQVVDTTWQVNYGVEIVDTNNTEHRFNFTDFAINER